MLLCEPREGVDELGMGDDSGERLPLEPDTRVEELLRLTRWPSTRDSAGGRDSGERLARQVEPIGDEPKRLLTLRGVLRLGEDLAGTHEPLLAVGGAVELEPDAVVQVALRLPEPQLEARRGRRPDPDPAEASPLGCRTPAPAPAPCRAGLPPRRRHRSRSRGRGASSVARAPSGAAPSTRFPWRRRPARIQPAAERSHPCCPPRPQPCPAWRSPVVRDGGRRGRGSS